MASAGEEEAATVFVETSIGTRLAVSFPASTTTVASLKRIVSQEHAASFPHILGRITLQSFKVRRRGSWYHLTDSMAVRAAFHGIKGAWHLQAHALLLHHSAAAPPTSSSNAVDMLLLHHALCSSQPNAAIASDAAAAASPSSMDQEEDHLVLGHAASALTRHATAGTSFGTGNVPGDPHAVADQDGYSHFIQEDPTGRRKHSREEQGGFDRDSMPPKRICAARDDGLSDAKSIDDVAVLSSDDDMLEDEDEDEPSVEELCDHEAKSITDDKESNSETPALRFSVKVKEEASTAATEKYADEGMAREKLVEQQDHLNNAQDSNSEALCFSVNKNFSNATEEHADEGMAQEKLVEQQDHLHKGAEVLQNCNSKDTPAIHSEHVSAGHQYEGSSRSFDLKCCKKSECEILAGQVGYHDRVCSEVARKKHDGSVKICGSVSATVGGCFDISTPSLSEKEVNITEQDYHKSDPLRHDFDDCAPSLGEKLFCGQKEPSVAEVCNISSSMKGKDLPPCAKSTEEGNSSERETMSRKVKGKEPWTAKMCDGERSSKKGTDLPPRVEALKEVNSSEKEGEEKQSTRTVTLVDVDGTKWTMQLDESDLPPCAKSTKEGNSSEKEEMAHKVKEEEPWTARVCHVERSSKGTDHPPCAGSMGGNNSSEIEGVAHEEKQRTRTVTLVDVDGTKWTMQLDDSFELGPQESSSSSDDDESYSHSVKPRRNAEERPDEGTPENGGTRVPIERSDLPRHCSFKTPTSNCPTGSKDAEGMSADGAEQGAWDGRRRPRHVVQKIPNSRAAKIYGYR